MTRTYGPVAADTEHLTCRGVVDTRGTMVSAPVGTTPNATSDPPFHRRARRLQLRRVGVESDRDVDRHAASVRGMHRSRWIRGPGERAVRMLATA